MGLARRYASPSNPLRLARTGTPGLHGLRARVPERCPQIRHRPARPGTGLRAAGFPRRTGLPGRDARRRQFRLRQPSIAGTFRAQRAFEETFAGKTENWHLHQVYDIAHNMGKIETHEVDGRQMKVCVHRKGATRAFGPGAPGLPPEYKVIGQPVIIPGSMGTASWVLVGTQESMTRSFGSSCHGAGRVMSRSKAKKTIRGDKLRRELEQAGIQIRAGSMPGLAEESPSAYKDVDAVVETVASAGIARKVARLRPVAVIKG